MEFRGRSVQIEHRCTGTLRTVGQGDVFSVAELVEFANEAGNAGAREVHVSVDGSGYVLEFVVEV